MALFLCLFPLASATSPGDEERLVFLYDDASVDEAISDLTFGAGIQVRAFRFDLFYFHFFLIFFFCFPAWTSAVISC